MMDAREVEAQGEGEVRGGKSRRHRCPHRTGGAVSSREEVHLVCDAFCEDGPFAIVEREARCPHREELRPGGDGVLAQGSVQGGAGKDVDRIGQLHVRGLSAACDQAQRVHYRVRKPPAGEPLHRAQGFGRDASSARLFPAGGIVEEQDLMAGLPQEKAEIGARQTRADDAESHEVHYT